MTSSALISIVFAGALLAIGIACWTLVIRLISRPKPRRLVPAAPAAPPVAALVQSPAATPTQCLPYARIPHLLTAAEGDFFVALQAAAPADMLIFAQVRLANLVEVQPRARRDKTHWYRIQAKCVDFVLCEPRTFIPCLVIELDDSSHNRADRRERDAFVDAVLAGAGIPILHVPWQRRYDLHDLTQQIAIKLPSAQPAEASWVPLPAPAPAIATAPLPMGVPTPTSMRRPMASARAS